MHQTATILATFLCSLVAGFLFAFAVVAMPGIGRLGDREFIRAFQVMDRVIQNNQPLFMVVWVGSILAIAAAGVLAFTGPNGAHRGLVIAATLLYLFGVQLPTFAINIPLNNRIQAHDVAATIDAANATARHAFEPRWNRWNAIRAAVACLVSLLLIVALTVA